MLIECPNKEAAKEAVGIVLANGFTQMQIGEGTSSPLLIMVASVRKGEVPSLEAELAKANCSVAA